MTHYVFQLLQRERGMYDPFESGFGDSFLSARDTREGEGRVFTGLCGPIDLLEQTREDGLSLPAISVALRRWALQQEDVEKVAVGYAGGQYSVAILFNELQIERISGLYMELASVLTKFSECRLLLYPLGPTQRDSILLNSVDCRIVYPA